MKWSKIITSYLVIAQLVLAPVLSHALNGQLDIDNNGRLTEEGKSTVAAAKNYAKENKLKGRLDLANKKITFNDPKTNKVVGEMALSDEKALLEYSPKTLNQKLMKELVKVKAANSAAWSHATRSFAGESAMFFLVLGGMVGIKLMHDYASDPVAMKHHIEQQLSPVGQMAFFMFMYSQGVTANTLSLWIKNPKLGLPIAMLGMTVGSAVQTYFSQVAADPHIRNCAASVFKGEKIEGNDHPCEGAYKYLVIDKKILEGPGVIALLGAFVASTGIRVALGASMKLVGFEIGMWLTPGGMAMKFARVLFSAANITSFTLFQAKIEHFATGLWKNYYDGWEFVEINDRLVSHIENQKASQWKSEAKDFNKEVREFSGKMKEWRITNLSDAYTANQSWGEFLNNLSSMYSASYSFYSTYLDHLKGKNSFIDRPYPLFGVIPKGLVAGHEDLYLTHPHRIEFMQIETINDVAAWIEQTTQSGYYKKLGFFKNQEDIISKIQQGLASEDISTKGTALLELNKVIAKDAKTVTGSLFGRELRRIHSLLGKPYPLLEKGRGFASSMLYAPSMISAFGDAKADDSNGHFSTPNITDYLVVQMMCGPNPSKGEKVVSVTQGFPAKFMAPTIALDDPSKKDLCTGTFLSRVRSERIFKDMPFSNYPTAPDFLRANLNPVVAEDFISWWEKGTETQMKEAYKGFRVSFKEVLSKLFKGLNQIQNNPWNRGFISNGAIPSAFQEMRLYALILGELLKDSYKVQYERDLPTSYYSDKIDPQLRATTSDYLTMSKKPLLGLLGRGSVYSFNALVGAEPNTKEVHSLKIQKELELLFSQMDGLVQRAKAHVVKSEEFENQMKAIEKKLTEFGALLGVSKDGVNIFAKPDSEAKNSDSGEETLAPAPRPEPSTLLKITKDSSASSPFLKPEVSVPSHDTLSGSDKNGPNQGLVTLDKEQKALAVTCLELLQSVAQELSMYGHMAGTALFEEKKQD
ncbi:MAG TPA: hypothetical protein VIG33_11310 [Pseudobdellovibrionaceae bacterium]